MQMRRTLAILGAVAVLAVTALPRAERLHAAARAADTLPARLTNEEFWRLSQDSSEPNGQFQSDNLVSNEIYLQWVIPDLLTRARQGGVYIPTPEEACRDRSSRP